MVRKMILKIYLKNKNGITKKSPSFEIAEINEQQFLQLLNDVNTQAKKFIKVGPIIFERELFAMAVYQ